MSKLTWPNLDDAALSGEQRLVAALLAQHIHDARRKVQPGSTAWWHREQARAWLLARDEVVAWLELAGLEEGVYGRVLEAAQLGEGRHG